MMDINLINMVKQPEPKQSTKKSKDIGDNSKFENSLKESQENGDNTKITKEKTVVDSEENTKIDDESLDEDVKKFLNNVEVILTLINNDSVKTLPNKGELNGDFALLNDEASPVSEEINITIQMDDQFFQNILSGMNIESQGKSVEEVVKNIINNSDAFTSLLKNELVNTLDENDPIVDAISQFEGINILDDGEMIENLRNEIKHRLNAEVKNNMNIDSNQNVNDINGSNINSGIEHDTLKGLESINNNNMNAFSFKAKNEDNIDVMIDKISNTRVEGGEALNAQPFNAMLRMDTSNIGEIELPTPVTSPNRIEFVSDFIDALDYMQTNNKTQMVVKLNSDQLGKMDIKYEVVKDNIRLNIRVESREALRVLENTIPDIRSMIKETHNINLDNVHVNLEQYTPNYDGQGENQRHNDNNEGQPKIPTIKINDNDEDEGNENLRRGILV